MNQSLVLNLSQERLPPSIGGKAVNLRQLLDRGYLIPRTWIIPSEAYDRYQQNDVSVVEQLRSNLSDLLPDNSVFAVRSSANIEDSLEHSFAGQFKSILNVTGIDQIMQSVWAVWSSTNTLSAQQYYNKLPPTERSLFMGVIIQEMVKPVVSGVVFSRNPMTGADEIVVEAVKGAGTQLMQDGINPARWVYKWGSWLMQPEDDTIPLSLIQQIVEQTQKISKAFSEHLDLEWVFNGEQVYWVQMREITTLRNLNIYSNRISREHLPGLIKPLIWSINIPLVNGAWIRLLTEMIGKNDLKPTELAKSFYYHAYFNMGALGRIFSLMGMPSESLEMMMGIVPREVDKPAFKPSIQTMRLLPRLIKVLVDKWYFARTVNLSLPLLKAQIEQIEPERIRQLPKSQIIPAVDSHIALTQQLAYFNIVGPLLMAMYNSVVRQQLRRIGVDFVNFDLTKDLPELDSFSPESYLIQLKQEFQSLPPDSREAIHNGNYADFQRLPGILKFQQYIAEFINRFGHLSDSGNDFSVKPWREQPDFILAMIQNYEYKPVRQEDRIQISDLPLRGVKAAIFHLFYNRAREYRLFREQISSLYTYTYGLFREYFLRTGNLLKQEGIIDETEDIFYLEWDQIKELLDKNEDANGILRLNINRHKDEMARSENIALPTVIYGDEPPPIIQPDAQLLNGTPTSRGYYQGPVKVVRGIGDFGKLKDGDVLVVPFSDVGWTPLFSRAGAIVAESGGLLSHSSIVAREYNIPAVVSVANACSLLSDGEVICVNGFNGEVVINPNGH